MVVTGLINFLSLEMMEARLIEFFILRNDRDWINRNFGRQNGTSPTYLILFQMLDPDCGQRRIVGNVIYL